ncbi:MAG TPA: hypothetical protein QGG93_09495 [Verrucomicrobiota bacterium]|nr:hypothetical protein [Verrucomicrobiota bacterium]
MLLVVGLLNTNSDSQIIETPIRIGGNSQDGIQSIGGNLARLATEFMPGTIMTEKQMN